MKKLVTLFLALSGLVLNAQTGEKCKTDQRHQALYASDPVYKANFDFNKDLLRNVISSGTRAGGVYTIPVVVHVIHKGEAVGTGTNISNAQIQSAITNLNNAYANIGYSGLDIEVQFALAVRSPTCGTTTGINRVNGSGVTAGGDNYTTVGITDNNETTIKALSRWSNSDYYNIWIVSEIDNNNGGAGTQGYAYFPGAGPNVDGAVILYNAFGYDPTGGLGYNLKSYTNRNATAIHELGHAFNLYHTFEGDGSGATCPPNSNCNTDGDECCDTDPHTRNDDDCTGSILPTCAGVSGTTVYNNFMAYSSDICQNRFTPNQKARIRAAIENNRASLLTSLALTTPPASPPSTVAISCSPVSSATGLGGGFGGIMSVTFGTITSTTSNTQTDGATYGTQGYLDFSEDCLKYLEVDEGDAIPISVTTWFNNHTVKVYVDWNNNGVFDNTTELMSTLTITGSASGGTNTATGTITMPGSVTTNQFLRLRFNADLSVPTGNCDAPTYGQVEDYSIFISPVTGTAPVANFTGSPTTVCAGQTVTFTNTSTGSPTSYSWSFTGGTPATSTATNPTVTYNTPGTYAVSLTATNGGGSDVETKTGYITVNALPTATASNTGGYCVGQTINLSTPAVTGATYAWTGPGGFTSTIRNPTRPSATVAMAGTYTVTVTAGGCSSTSSTTVAVNALPTATATNTGPVCAGSPITISTPAVTGATYAWTGPGGYTSAVRNPTITGTTTAMSGTYTVTVTNGGCSNTSSTTVTINPAPTATATNTGGYCVGQTISLSTPTVAGATYTWSGPTFTSTSQNPTRPSATVAMAGTYTVTVTAGGCSSTSSTTVAVNALPTATATNTGPVCAGSSITISTPAVTGATYSWTGPGGYTSTVRNPTITGTTTAMSGTYTVTVTNGACSNTSSTTVTINPAPTATASNTGGYCVGQTISLNTPTVAGATYAWTGPGGFNSTLQNPTRPSATVAMAGSYTVTVTLGSCTATSSTTVAVSALPTATATNTGPVCAGSSITISTPAVTGATYSWTGPGGYTSTVRNPAITGTTTAMSGTYTVTVTNGACSNTSSTTVTINPAPTATASNTGGYCVGQTISLNTPTVAGATYAWTGPGGFNSTLQNPTRPSATVAMAGSYTVTVTLGSCTATSSTTVAVSALPTATATNTGPVCAGSSITISTPAVTGATYSWTGPGGYTSTVRNPAITGTTTAMSGTYTVTVTNGACSNTSSTTVTINPAPAAAASNDGPYCVGETINLATTTVAGATYAWTGPATFTSTLQNPTRASATAAMAGTYNLTVTLGSCTATSSTAVVVNAVPVATATNTGPVCEGQPFTISTPVVGGVTYAWTGPGGYTSSIRNPTVTGSTVAMGGTYTVTVTNTTTGCSRTSSTTVVVNPGPTSSATNNGPLCVGTTLNLGTPPVAGATYAWTGPAGYNSTLQNPTRPTVTLAMAGTYTVTVTSGACSTSSSTTVAINPVPVAVATNNGPVCEGSPLNLGTTTVSGATYAWTGPGGFTSTSEDPVITSPATTASGTYTVTVSALGCNNTSSTTVTVNPLPNVVATNDGPVCAGGTLNLGSNISGATYAWSGPGGYTSATQNPVLSPVSAGMAGTYTVSITDGNGCVNTGTTTITVNTLPVINAGTDVSVCPGESTTLTASGGTTYLWSPTAGLTSPATASTGASPTVTTLYMVTSSDGICSNTDSVEVTVFPAPPVPTVTHAFDSLMVSPSTGGYTYQWFLDGNPISGATGPVYHATANGEYTVEITDPNGCTSVSADHIYNSTGMVQLNNGKGFSLYPNPSNGSVTLVFNQPVEKDSKMVLYDALGQHITTLPVSTTNGSINLQLHNLSRGTYTVTVINGNNRYYQKLVINY